MRATHLWIIIAAFCANQLAFASAAIVSTIKPIHNIVLQLTQGNYTPVLLAPELSGCVHHYELRPSQHIILQQADLIFAHSKSLAAKMPNRRVIYVDEFFRDKEHYWLSAKNTIAIASIVLAELNKFAPEKHALWAANHHKFTAKIEKHFVDATKYFVEHQFNYISYHDDYRSLLREIKHTAFILNQHNEFGISAKKLKEAYVMLQRPNSIILVATPKQRERLKKIFADTPIIVVPPISDYSQAIKLLMKHNIRKT